MTYGVKHIVGIYKARSKNKDFEAPKGFFGTQGHLLGEWGTIGDNIYLYLWGCHMGHLTELLVAILCYVLLYADGSWLQEAQTWQAPWMLKIVGFNLACEFVICNFWHWFVYVNQANVEALKPYKFNPVNQYEPQGGQVGMLSSTSGNLQREVLFTTLGWLQSAFWQILFTHLWAIGFFSLPDMSQPIMWYYTGFLMIFVTYWREIHFYWAHRGMHPWFDRERGLLDGDIGAFLYRHAHSLHHKSYNPGPWSGLCMHPIEHFLYYTCATVLPLVFPMVHPLVFLYCKFHADIAPIGGHDGHEAPNPNGDFHWLHHAKFECNYGVPFPINFDKIFGTWQEYKEYKENGGKMKLGSQRAMQQAEKAQKAIQSADLQEPLLADESADEPIDPTSPLTLEQVAGHNSQHDCWVVLKGMVLDITQFISTHPGGEKVLLDRAGKDVTLAFIPIHREGIALVDKFAGLIRQVGTLAES